MASSHSKVCALSGPSARHRESAGGAITGELTPKPLGWRHPEVDLVKKGWLCQAKPSNLAGQDKV